MAEAHLDVEWFDRHLSEDFHNTNPDGTPEMAKANAADKAGGIQVALSYGTSSSQSTSNTSTDTSFDKVLQSGAKTVLIERAGVGGSAVLTDVVPSKTLIATADAAVAVGEASELGVQFRNSDSDEIEKPAITVNLESVNKRLLALAKSTSKDMTTSTSWRR